MELRHIVPVVVLVGAALFLVFRSDDKGKDDQLEEKNVKSKQAAPSPSSGNGEEEEAGGRVVSKRVLRDQPKVITTDSGLQYEILAEGEGANPGPTSKVKVHYTGTLDDGTVFD